MKTTEDTTEHMSDECCHDKGYLLVICTNYLSSKTHPLNTKLKYSHAIKQRKSLSKKQETATRKPANECSCTAYQKIWSDM